MSDEAVTRWIESLETGDEDAAARLWEYCFPRMLRYASRRLPDNLRRAMDEEDVAISAFRSFCMATARGAFTELNGRDELWRLLLCITARKARARIRHETREKRGGGKVGGESILMTGSDQGSGGQIGQVPGHSPSPEMLAQFADECQWLLDQLGDDTLKAIALLRVEGYTVDEIAQRVGCAKRSVERRLTLIRKTWSHHSQQLD
jgi:RNA polymerase sigma factor (sigma-70 family)